jgi:predicted metalloprotease
MRWKSSGRSSNLEDRRGSRGSIGRGVGGLGIGGVVLVLVISLVTKQNPLTLLGALEGGSAISTEAAPINDPAEEQQVLFISVVLDSAQSLWHRKLANSATPYRDAQLVLFRDMVQSACGQAPSATGPFYCPGDEKVYIDLGFYRELKDRFGAPGDFAEAYVLAHEIGHHVQNLLGTEASVRRAQQGRPGDANALSIAMELQADCYAGVWGNQAERDGMLEAGDLEEGLGAAAAVGDDRIQRMGPGGVNPETWTHGSAEMRVRWFRTGFESGDPAACDTFR